MRIARLVAALAIIAGLAVALVAVNVAGRDDDTEIGAPQAGPTRTTAPPPGSTATADESPLAVPTPDTTGRDFDRIIREILAFEDWLFAHPDPGLLDLVIHPECECFEDGVRRLTELRERGLHFEGPTLVVQSVTVAQEFEPVVRLEVDVTQPQQQLVDDRGKVVDVVPDEGPATYGFSLVVDGNGRWRIRTSEIVGGAQP